MRTAPIVHKYLPLLLPAILAAAILYYATGIYGVGVGRDSVAYLSAAKNLAGKQAYPIAYAPCTGGCSLFEMDLQAVADNHHDEPLIVWVPGHGEAECIRCLSALATDYGFTLIMQDGQFQVYERAVEDVE